MVAARDDQGMAATMMLSYEDALKAYVLEKTGDAATRADVITDFDIGDECSECGCDHGGRTVVFVSYIRGDGSHGMVDVPQVSWLLVDLLRLADGHSLAPKCHTCNKAYVRPPHTECTTCYRQRTGDWKGRPS